MMQPSHLDRMVGAAGVSNQRLLTPCLRPCRTVRAGPDHVQSQEPVQPLQIEAATPKVNEFLTQPVVDYIRQRLRHGCTSSRTFVATYLCTLSLPEAVYTLNFTEGLPPVLGAGKAG